MKRFLFAFATLFLPFFAAAQDFEFGQYQLDELTMKSYPKDTAAHAVVLREIGDARIQLDAVDNLRLFFTYHVKIKILDEKGYKKGNIELPFYTGDNNTMEEISDIKGITYYTDENGNSQQAVLEKKNIFTEKNDKHWSSIKFAMPSLRKGCVIEYSYHEISPYYYYSFHTWEFQDDIPKVYSEFTAHIPAYYTYKATLRGPLKLTKNLGEVENDCISIRGVKNPCSKLTYAIADVPAFVEEDYMTAAKNYLSAVYFDLENFVNPYTGVKNRVTKEWADIDKELKDNQEFGSQMKKKELFKEKIKEITAGKDDLTKAKAVYAFVQKWFKWNKYVGIYSEDIKDAVAAHTGSVGDINFSLASALNEAGIPSEVVLLSTRSHGTINMLYPVINDFNYVIVKANIGEKSYFLDATDPYLGFGMLPLQCINDKGRVYSLNKPSYWVDLTNIPQRESDSYTFDLTLEPSGKFKGTMTHYSTSYSAYKKRLAIKKFNSVDEYVENLDEKMPEIKILKSQIDNLDSLDLALGEKYEIEMNGFENTSRDSYNFNPYVVEHRIVNPFKLAERDYPVDWGMPSATNCNVIVHLPEGFSAEAPAKTWALALPNNGGRFITNFEGSGNQFTFSYLTQFTKSVYSPAEYPSLKEFYNRIISAERERLILKKKAE